MIKLEDRDWDTYFLSDIFEIEKCKCSNVSKLGNGNFPYIGATNRNNGLLSFVKREEKLVSKGKCIVFVCDGEGSIGYSFYKEEDFIGSTTLKVGRNNKLNKFNAFFITTVADTVRGKYSFGFKRNELHLKKETLQLPKDKNGNPDWQFMEDYVKERYQLLISQYKKYLETLNITEGAPTALDEKEWLPFYFKDIFTEIQRGKRLKTSDHISGKVPYVSSSAVNNGVDNFIGNQEKVRVFNNTISLANSGSVGKAFFHKYSFVASDHVTKLQNDRFTKFIYLFLLPIVSRLEEKYNFNREINDKRINKEVMLLPVSADKTPDWEYMEIYTKWQMKQQLQSYLKYKD